MTPETASKLQTAFDALSAARAERVSAHEEYAANPRADPDEDTNGSVRSQYDRTILAFNAKVEMAEHEVKYWEAQARLEGVEAERDRAIRQTKHEQIRSDNAQKRLRKYQTCTLLVGAAGAAMTLIAAVIAALLTAQLTRHEASPTAPVQLPAVFSVAIVSEPPVPSVGNATLPIASAAKAAASATPPLPPSTAPRKSVE